MSRSRIKANTTNIGDDPKEKFELRHFQLLLKREDILNKFHDDELEKIKSTIQDEYEFVLFSDKLLLEYHMGSIGMSGLSLPQPVFDSLCHPIDGNSRPTQLLCKKEIQDYYTPAIKHFVKNPLDFSRVCVEYALTHEDEIDRLTFSIIPSFFGYLSSKQMTERYINFLKDVIIHSVDVAQKFGRLIFALPDFRVFLTRVVEKLVKPIHNVTGDGKRFKKEFCDRWARYAEYCPSIVRTILQLFPNKEKFLANAFIIPAMQSLKIYELIPYSASVSIEMEQVLTQVLVDSAKFLVQQIDEAKYPVSAVYIKDIFEITPDVLNTFIFSYQDLQLLSELVHYSHKVLNKFPVKRIPFKDSFMTRDYSAYVFKFEENVKKAARKSTIHLSSHDVLESELRSILTELSLIPLGTAGIKDISMDEILSKQVLLASDDSRLHLELRVHDYKKSYQRVVDEGTTYSITDLLKLMKRKFAEREKDRREKVKAVSTYNASVSQLKGIKRRLLQLVPLKSLIFQSQLVDKWNEEKNPLRLLNESVYKTKELFQSAFQNIVDNFNEWLSIKGYSPINDYAIVHDLVMRNIPLVKFRTYQPRLSKMDNACLRALTEHEKEFINDTKEPWMDVIINNNKLIDPAINLLNKFYNTEATPLDKIMYLNKFRDKVDQIVKYEIKDDVGADQVIPMILCLLCKSHPKMLPSNLEYVDFYFKSITENCPDIPLLKHNSQSSYVAVMMQAAMLHIKDKFPNIDPNHQPSKH